MSVLSHRVNSYNTVEVTDGCTMPIPADAPRAGPITPEEFEEVTPLSTLGIPLSVVQHRDSGSPCNNGRRKSGTESSSKSLCTWPILSRSQVTPLSFCPISVIQNSVRLGFQFHHCEADYLILSAWLKDSALNKLPPGWFHDR